MLVDLATVPGDHHGKLVADQLMDVVVRVEPVRLYVGRRGEGGRGGWWTSITAKPLPYFAIAAATAATAVVAAHHHTTHHTPDPTSLSLQVRR